MTNSPISELQHLKDLYTKFPKSCSRIAGQDANLLNWLNETKAIESTYIPELIYAVLNPTDH